MGIDQAGQNGMVTQVDDSGSGRNRNFCADLFDAFTGNQNDGVLQRRVSLAIDEVGRI
ncbi:hypothetical protein IIA29_09125 [candidate division KSB1 bacterium]|nr:hypothetical protein [candidate division KSB1 bacterium]